jgi:hypothetical protein
MKDKELFSKVNPTSEELQERIDRTVTIYNHQRSTLSDDEVARLRAYLSCDMYSFVAKVYKPALDDEAICEIELERIESLCYMEYFEKLRADKMSASAAETVARKMTKMDERYLSAFHNMKQSKNISILTNHIMKAGTNVLHSMSYKSQ